MGRSTLKVVTGAEMAEIETASGVPVPELIDRAGAAVSEAASRLAPAGSVVVLAGPGNNGADGLVAAERLRVAGRTVLVYTFNRADSLPFCGPAETAESALATATFGATLEDAAIIVDALLGTGQNRAPASTLDALLSAVNDARGPSTIGLSVDLPTGVNADSGELLGKSFRADSTLCLGFIKRGAVLPPGAGRAGAILLADLGLSASIAAHVCLATYDDLAIASLLPQRDREGNKGSSGRMLFVGGSRDFVGAPVLASVAAYRAGAGLVEMAIPGSIQTALAAHALEPVYCPLPEVDGYLSPEAEGILRERMSKAKALVFGCGMGLTDGTIALTKSMLDIVNETETPAVFDADALNALSRIPEWWRHEPDHSARATIVLTPHPGEMARLTGMKVSEVQAHRVETAVHWARVWNQTVVFKGAGTIIATPDGQAVVNQTGGPNLATAGTGDVLSGIIGGLLAQGCSQHDAAVAGAYLHGRAGDLLLAQQGEIGLIASDLHVAIPAARRSIVIGNEVPE